MNSKFRDTTILLWGHCSHGLDELVYWAHKTPKADIFDPNSLAKYSSGLSGKLIVSPSTGKSACGMITT